MMDQCTQTISVAGCKVRCDLPLGPNGMCGFTFEIGNVHWIDRRLSDKEMQELSRGIYLKRR